MDIIDVIIRKLLDFLESFFTSYKTVKGVSANRVIIIAIFYSIIITILNLFGKFTFIQPIDCYVSLLIVVIINMQSRIKKKKIVDFIKSMRSEDL